jgi:hypothetical protein
MTEEMQAMVDTQKDSVSNPTLAHLLVDLQWLVRLLEHAVVTAQRVYGPQATTDPFRGLHLGTDDITRLLARQPGMPTFYPEAATHAVDAPDLLWEGPRLAWLAQVFDLSPFDLYVILSALAPEVDLRYERLYAYLQDDVSRRRPSVDLALNLLCPSAEAKLMRQAHFTPDAPLLRHSLLHVLPDPHQSQPPLLAHTLKLDDQIVQLLLDQDGLNRRLASCYQMLGAMVSMDALSLSDEVKQALLSMVVRAATALQPLRLYFSGPQGMGKRQAAEALASALGMPLLTMDIVRARGTGFEPILRLIIREAWFCGALLYLDGLDTLRSDEQAMTSLVEALAEHAGITMLAGMQPWAFVHSVSLTTG